MIQDAQLLYSDAQAITADVVSTNQHRHIPLGIPAIGPTGTSVPAAMANAGLNIGIGQPLYGAIHCDVLLAGTSETLTIHFVTGDATLTLADTIIWSSQSYTALAAGTNIFFEIPPVTTFLEYTGFFYDVGGTSPTVTLTAALTTDIYAWEKYADGRHFA